MSSFADQVRSISDAVGEQSGCFPTFMVIGAFVPLVIFLLLYFVQPSFVQVKDGSSFSKSNKKIGLWTLGVTMLIWAGMFLFTYCQGYGHHEVCLY